MEGKNDLPVTRFRDTIEVIGAMLEVADEGWIFKTHLLRSVQFGNQPGAWYLDSLEEAGYLESHTEEGGRGGTYVRNTLRGHELMLGIKALMVALDPVPWGIWRKRHDAKGGGEEKL